MRILFISYNGALTPLLQSQGLPYLSGAAKAKHEITLLTYENDLTSNEGEKEYARMAQRLSAEKIRWVPLKFHRRPHILAKIYDLAQGAIVSIFLVYKYKIETVHCRGIFTTLIGLVTVSVSRRAMIFDERSKLSEAYAVSGRWKKGTLIFNLMNFLESLCERCSKGIVVETDFHKDQIMKVAQKDRLISVIPCCVDLSRFKNTTNSTRGGGLAITYLGSLSGWYCFDEIIGFFQSTKEILPQARLNFLTRDNPEEIRRRIAGNNAELLNSVMINNAAPEEVPKLLSFSRAGIVFRYPGSRLSSFPIKIGEYLAAGLPVVLNKGMGQAEAFISENKVGVVIKGLTDNDYKEGVMRLLDLLNEESIAKRCRKAAESLSMEIGIEKYLDLYERVGRQLYQKR
ncbi:MAG: hypothetical protein PHT31_00945 [Candidatus Omnitrophica bacterium]|nr:hypothetical protein [Candidatus Omnitrophota bacterium]MDD5652712.1 hypothetical protein [Candidatus Omnitrophota bacterium]